MIRSIIPLLLVSLSLLSCDKSNEGLKLELTNHQISWEEKDAIIFVPYQGCSGCVAKAIQFINNHLKSDQYLFVFVNYRSKKEIQVRMRINESDFEAFRFIEQPAPLYKEGISQLYPSIVQNKANKVDIKIADPNHLGYWDELN